MGNILPETSVLFDLSHPTWIQGSPFRLTGQKTRIHASELQVPGSSSMPRHPLPGTTSDRPEYSLRISTHYLRE